ncbi:TPA: mannose-6-phosphate isomerase, class I [Vibrio parahaemolyticus]|uniref:mannose-6-phosphate isomerase, class I n=1 Tax=Vibrio parahaemolyticus TaxID=670 RepID=UPI001123B33E|nr:mannose-6-phosphate isomerase, class I [Vibrio parahaemolyticus]TOB87920.1 mannose-6-phosphate isomerase, class I [Vibrio parahaemolyticus]HCG7972819.1 mannose-6-phosphate isomerase, class I [Vibrio parahaemolyticus]
MTQYLFKLENEIKNYEWGSKTAISTLFGLDNHDGAPQAELWMGAHANGCSKVIVNNQSTLLSDLINQDKVSCLSLDTTERFGSLPFLFKVLAAESALSVQVHPNKKEAELGFQKEESAGVPRSDPTRNYRDANHKPELVYAITPYKAMNGFRNFDEIISNFSLFLEGRDSSSLTRMVKEFKLSPSSQNLQKLFVGVLCLDGKDKINELDALLSFAHSSQSHDNDIYTTIIELASHYPQDMGLFSPLFLNVITLEPGQAMYLDARTPHAYIKGVGLEVMANSDNVLRAGLTSKCIDVDELSKCTLFKEKPESALLTVPSLDGHREVYPIPVSDFCFDCFIKADGEVIGVNSAEIIFAIDSEVIISHASGEKLRLSKGESAFIPARARQYTLFSSGRIARVYNQ